MVDDGKEKGGTWFKETEQERNLKVKYYNNKMAYAQCKSSITVTKSSFAFPFFLRACSYVIVIHPGVSFLLLFFFYPDMQENGVMPMIELRKASIVHSYDLDN